MRAVIAALAVFIFVMLGYLVWVNWWPSARGSVVVISEPPGAQIWVDLQPTDAVTDGTVRDLSTGEHSVTVRLDTLMADPFAQVVQVHAGQPDTIHFVLRNPSGDKPIAHAVYPVPTATTVPDVLPNAAPLTPESLLATIPTAAALRAGMTSPDTARVQGIRPDTSIKTVEPPAVLPATPPEASMARPDEETGAIQISSSEPGATITINDHIQDERTPATIKLAFGTYTIHVELAGYKVTPDEQSVRITRATNSPYIHFTLEKTDTVVRSFAVKTTPIEGRIFVDGILVGEGTTSCQRDYGTYTVTFGDVDGWHTPKPERVSLTPSNLHDDVTGNYTRIFHAFAEANGESKVEAEGIAKWTTGVVFEDGKPQPSEALGPKIRKIPGSKKFGWELAMGDPTRNPTGGDYVGFTFTLPDDVSPNNPMNLRLYLYKSDQKYPFVLSGGRSVIEVSVNGHRFLDGFTPQYDAAGADQNQYEEWALHGLLKSGENVVMVYTGKGNTLLNYLWKIEIL